MCIRDRHNSANWSAGMVPARSGENGPSPFKALLTSITRPLQWAPTEDVYKRQVYEATSPDKAAQEAVSLIREGHADVLMKGLSLIHI